MVALGRDLGYVFNLRLWVDSITAKAIVTRLGLGKVRHMEVKFLWAQEALRRKLFEMRKITGERNPADESHEHGRDEGENRVHRRILHSGRDFSNSR